MPSCEKCWSDAHRGPMFSVAEEYHKLLAERKDNPCTPEQQAGINATICPICDRFTVHQHCKICMVCGAYLGQEGHR